jgi:hypothetical protein
VAAGVAASPGLGCGAAGRRGQDRARGPDVVEQGVDSLPEPGRAHAELLADGVLALAGLVQGCAGDAEELQLVVGEVLGGRGLSVSRASDRVGPLNVRDRA